MIDKRSKRWQYWSWVVLWVGLIYSTLYIVRPICEFLKSKTPFLFFINFFLILLLGFILAAYFQKQKIKRIATLFLLSGIIGMYILGMWFLKIPEEKIHFVEYGFLGFLIYQALRLDCSDPLAYGGAFILTSLLGWADEGIQYLLPNRYYQLKDVILNSMSGGLGLILTYILRREN